MDRDEIRLGNGFQFSPQTLGTLADHPAVTLAAAKHHRRTGRKTNRRDKGRVKRVDSDGNPANTAA